MPSNDGLQEIAVGAERSRRAAWARFYEADRQLRRYRNEAGETWVYFACPCCGGTVEMQVLPVEVSPDGCLEHWEGMPLRHRPSVAPATSAPPNAAYVAARAAIVRGASTDQRPTRR